MVELRVGDRVDSSGMLHDDAVGSGWPGLGFGVSKAASKARRSDGKGREQ